MSISVCVGVHISTYVCACVNYSAFLGLKDELCLHFFIFKNFCSLLVPVYLCACEHTCVSNVDSVSWSKPPRPHPLTASNPPKSISAPHVTTTAPLPRQLPQHCSLSLSLSQTHTHTHTPFSPSSCLGPFETIVSLSRRIIYRLTQKIFVYLKLSLVDLIHSGRSSSALQSEVNATTYSVLR